MAVLDDATDFRIDLARGLFAQRRVGSIYPSGTQVRILTWRKLYQPQLVAHPPARHHAARERSGLLDVVFGSGGSRTVHHLFRRAPAEHTDDPCLQIGFRIVV